MENSGVIKRIEEFVEYDALLSYSAFAIKVGIDPSGFHKMLKGQMPITKGALNKIATAYNLRLEWLLTGEEPMHRAKSAAAPILDASDIHKTDVKGNNNSNVGIHNDSEIIKGLLASLSERDKQINNLLALLEQKDKQINKLIDKITNFEL